MGERMLCVLFAISRALSLELPFLMFNLWDFAETPTHYALAFLEVRRSDDSLLDLGLGCTFGWFLFFLFVWSFSSVSSCPQSY
jgi:hypothetical protein